MSADAAPATGIRCFIALRPDAASVRALERARAALEQASLGATRGVRWIGAPALHLTLRFLGDSTRAQVEYLRHMLPTLARPLPAIAAHRYGVWPNRARPRLLVLELATHPDLQALADACEAHARKAGYDGATSRFRPHLTLARLRPGCAFGILPDAPPALTFTRVALLRSTLTQPAATYTELDGIALDGPRAPA